MSLLCLNLMSVSPQNEIPTSNPGRTQLCSSLCSPTVVFSLSGGYSTLLGLSSSMHALAWRGVGVCMCVYPHVCAPMCSREIRGGCQMSLLYLIHHDPPYALRQGLSQYLALSQQPTSPCNPPVSTSTQHWGESCMPPCQLFTSALGIQTQFLIKQVLLPTTPSSPDPYTKFLWLLLAPSQPEYLCLTSFSSHQSQYLSI